MQEHAADPDLIHLDAHRPKPKRGGNNKGTRRSFGNLRKLPSGRWQASYTGPDGERQKAETTFLTKGDAEQWLSLKQAEIIESRWKPPAPKRVTETFADYAARWLPDRRVKGEELKPRTRVEYQRLLDQLILPTFGDRVLPEITQVDVKAWYATLDPTKKTRRAHAYALLRTVLGSAVDDELIVANPARIKGAGATKRQRPIRPASIPELGLIMDNMPERYRLMILLAAWCALRFGEIAELRRKDVDLENQLLHITRGVTWVEGRAVVGDPKSEHGIRDVTIPPHLIPAIQAHSDEFAEPGPDGLLFHARAGHHMLHSTLYDVYGPARERAGRPDLRFHDLRHSGAVLAAVAGATLAELMQRLGHGSPQMAMRYQHIAEGRAAEVARRMSAMVEPAE